MEVFNFNAYIIQYRRYLMKKLCRIHYTKCVLYKQEQGHLHHTLMSVPTNSLGLGLYQVLLTGNLELRIWQLEFISSTKVN